MSSLASRRSRSAARCLPGLALLLALALSGRAQQHPDPSATPSFQQTASQEQIRGLEQFPENDPVEKERRLRAFNAQRHKSMVSDANKLIKLARELEDEVSRTNPDSFTPAELRKVAQIEKLAHSVKQKMSASALEMPEPMHLSPSMSP